MPVRKRQVEYRDVFRYFKPKELKEEELDRVLDILAENQVQILDGEEEPDDPETEPEKEAARTSGGTLLWSFQG